MVYHKIQYIILRYFVPNSFVDSIPSLYADDIQEQCSHSNSIIKTKLLYALIMTGLETVL